MHEGLRRFIDQHILRKPQSSQEESIDPAVDPVTSELTVTGASKFQLDPNYPDEIYPEITSVVHSAYRQYGGRIYY